MSKLVFIEFWARLAAGWDDTQAAPLLFAFVVPMSVPLWQAASGLNAVLAWVLYGIADLALHRYDDGRPPNEIGLNFMLRTMALVRWILSLYTITIALYIAASLYEEFGLPPIGKELFPPGLVEMVKRWWAVWLG